MTTVLDAAERTTGGLTSAEAARRLRENGPNVLPAGGGAHPVVLLLKQFAHFFAILLWVAAALAYVAGMPALSVAIALVVVLNGGFAFAQEYRADRAADRLREMLPAQATVRRDGRFGQVTAVSIGRLKWRTTRRCSGTFCPLMPMTIGTDMNNPFVAPGASLAREMQRKASSRTPDASHEHPARTRRDVNHEPVGR